jgi:hypothetical protein
MSISCVSNCTRGWPPIRTCSPGGDPALGCRLALTRTSGLSAAARRPAPTQRQGTRWAPVLALAACLVLAAAGPGPCGCGDPAPNGSTSVAVAMLTRTVDAQWGEGTEPPRAGSSLDPGWLRLESGMAQIVFYSGARVVIEGPAELRLVSPSEAVCRSGRLLAEVPEPARGFRLERRTSIWWISAPRSGSRPPLVEPRCTSSKGKVELFAGQARGGRSAKPRPPWFKAARPHASWPPTPLPSPRCSSSSNDRSPRRRSAMSSGSSQMRSTQRGPLAAGSLDLQNLSAPDWTLRNSAANNHAPGLEGVIVGCARTEGRWREKQALEFQSVNDRVRMGVPGEFASLTLSAWVCILGLDRQFNSLFMCDGFAPGNHSLADPPRRRLGVTVFGDRPGRFQIMPAPRRHARSTRPVAPFRRRPRWPGQARRSIISTAPPSRAMS